MGMKNKQTVGQDLNSGEFTEFVFALFAIAKQTNSSIEEVYANISIVSGKVTGKHKGVEFFGDGKQIPPYNEFAQWIAGNTSATVQQWVEKTQQFIYAYNLPYFNKVMCEGGSSNKIDVGLYSSAKLVEGFSLKWNHDAVERSQSPNWRSVNKFYGKFVDISEKQGYYQEQFNKFTTPGFRYSDNKGDWSPELLKCAEVMRETVCDLENYTAKQFINKNFDSKELAKNIIECFTGGKESIVLVELKSATSKTISHAMIPKLAETLDNGQFTFEQVKGNRTHDTYIRMNNKDFLHFRTTASADKAPRQQNNDLRRIKRQTYLTINLPTIK